MGTVSRTTLNTGDIPTAAQWNTQFDTIYSEFNGSIESANMDATFLATIALLADNETVAGQWTFADVLNVNASAYIAGALNVTGALTAAGTVYIGGQLTLATNLTAGNVSADNIYSNLVQATNVNCTNLTGTIQTASQTNITALGTLTSLAITGNLTVDTSTLSVDATANEVGIGVASGMLGKLHVQEGSAGGSGTVNAVADTLVLENSDSGGITILTPDDKDGLIFFADESANAQGRIGYNHTSDKMTFHTGAASRMVITLGMVMGAPTGGDKGAGTINATGVYDDNVLLTDYIFEIKYDGKPVDEKYKDYVIKSLKEEIEHTKQNKHLSTIIGRDEWVKNGNASLGELSTDFWKAIETNFLYISELDQRVDELERKVA